MLLIDSITLIAVTSIIMGPIYICIFAIYRHFGTIVRGLIEQITYAAKWLTIGRVAASALLRADSEPAEDPILLPTDELCSRVSNLHDQLDEPGDFNANLPRGELCELYEKLQHKQRVSNTILIINELLVFGCEKLTGDKAAIMRKLPNMRNTVERCAISLVDRKLSTLGELAIELAPTIAISMK